MLWYLVRLATSNSHQELGIVCLCACIISVCICVVVFRPVSLHRRCRRPLTAAMLCPALLCATLVLLTPLELSEGRTLHPSPEGLQVQRQGGRCGTGAGEDGQLGIVF